MWDELGGGSNSFHCYPHQRLAKGVGGGGRLATSAITSSNVWRRASANLIPAAFPLRSNSDKVDVDGDWWSDLDIITPAYTTPMSAAATNTVMLGQKVRRGA